MLNIISSLAADSVVKGYLYPVDTIYHEDLLKMCVLYQTSNNLELYFWDPATHKATLGLLSFFNPTSLTVLPDKQAFSFIDNDRIKVKEISKRSAKSVDLYGPYDLSCIHWIDNKNFYFSAKERRHHNLFHATIDGDLIRLTVSNTNHYVYPCKINTQLFFIEQNPQGDYHIKTMEYPLEEIEHILEKCSKSISLEEEVQSIMTEEQSKDLYRPILDINSASTVIFFDKETLLGNAIAFLSMVSPQVGFFVRYNDFIHKDQKTLLLDYYTFYQEEQKWKSKKLFTWSLPLSLIIPYKDEIVMNESIFPFLPFHSDSHIYFNNYDQDAEKLALYRYNQQTGEIKECTANGSQSSIFFAPRLLYNKLICGTSHLTNDSLISLQDDGFHYFNIPSLTDTI